MIKAECHSDDRNVEVEFDATKWFKRATKKAILALAGCGWRGDYPADAVAEFMANHNSEVADMYKYLSIINRKRTVCGFECSVNESDAMEWLKINRPNIFKALNQ